MEGASGRIRHYNGIQTAMSVIHKINNLFRPAQLTPMRMGLAVIVALIIDGLQVPLQAAPLAPQILDVIAMVVTSLLIGFHLLLLPTFVVEFIPMADMLPTWTGCVIAVIALRRTSDSAAKSLGSSPPAIPQKSKELSNSDMKKD